VLAKLFQPFQLALDTAMTFTSPTGATARPQNHPAGTITTVAGGGNGALAMEARHGAPLAATCVA